MTALDYVHRYAQLGAKYDARLGLDHRVLGELQPVASGNSRMDEYPFLPGKGLAEARPRPTFEREVRELRALLPAPGT